MQKIEGKTIIFYDGACILCNGFIKYIFKRDHTKTFYFSQLQSKYALSTLSNFGLEPKKLETMVLVHDNKLYSKGLAALKIIELLPFGIHKVLLIGKILPTFIINRIYDFVASIRYKIFGKKEECTIPSSDIRQRYIIN